MSRSNKSKLVEKLSIGKDLTVLAGIIILGNCYEKISQISSGILMAYENYISKNYERL